MVLGNDIRISEVGFDRHDGETLDTFELLVQWHQLMIALERLQAHLDIEEETLDEESVSVESMRRF